MVEERVLGEDPRRAPDEVGQRSITADARVGRKPPEVDVDRIPVAEIFHPVDVRIGEQRLLFVEDVVGRWMADVERDRQQQERHKRVLEHRRTTGEIAHHPTLDARVQPKRTHAQRRLHRRRVRVQMGSGICQMSPQSDWPPSTR